MTAPRAMAFIGFVASILVGDQPAAAGPQCPLPQEEAVLLPPVPQFQGFFGKQVAVFGDRVLVSEPKDQNYAVHVFELDSQGVWFLDETISSPSSPFGANQFGYAADLSHDTIVVGAPQDSTFGGGAGAVYVYGPSGAGGWALQQLLSASDAGFSQRFGWTVSLSGDQCAVGAPQIKKAVYVFERPTSSGWVEVAKLLSPRHPVADGFGQSVAMSGGRLIAGARFDDGLGLDAGAAYIFERDPLGAWTLAATLRASDGTQNDKFGEAVSISGDVAAVGAPQRETDVPGSIGVVYLFERSPDGTWHERDEVIPSGTDYFAYFGRSVSVAGQHLLVGSPEEQSPLLIGAAYVFTRQSGGEWLQTARMTPSTATPLAGYGWSCALRGDVAVVGAHKSAFGEAFVLSVPVGVSAYCTPKTTSAGCVPRIEWTGSASLSSSAHLRIRAEDVHNEVVGILFYGTGAPPVPFPFQGGWMCVPSPLTRTAPQLSGGNPPPTDCSGSFNFDFMAYALSGVDAALVPGAVVYGQYWFRDPASPSTTGLTDAIAVELCP